MRTLHEAKKIKRVLLSLFIPAMLLFVTACPGVIIDNITIDFGPMGPVVGTTGTFTCISPTTAAVIGVEWRFGDGTTATGQTANHIYVEPGTYIIECKILTPSSIFVNSTLLDVNLFSSNLGGIDELTNTIGFSTCDGLSFSSLSDSITPIIPNLDSLSRFIFASGGGDASIGIMDGTILIRTTGPCDWSSTLINWADSSISNLVDFSSFSQVKIFVDELTGGPVTDCVIGIVDNVSNPGVVTAPFSLSEGLNVISIAGGVNMDAMSFISLAECNIADVTQLVISAFAID